MYPGHMQLTLIPFPAHSFDIALAGIWSAVISHCWKGNQTHLKYAAFRCGVRSDVVVRDEGNYRSDVDNLENQSVV